jgi:hypothetical protein
LISQYIILLKKHLILAILNRIFKESSSHKEFLKSQKNCN